jgi:tetratricopeptide (TPR) repeat protein
MKRSERSRERASSVGRGKSPLPPFPRAYHQLPLEERRQVQESLLQLRRHPDHLGAVENLLRVFCRSGDMVTALRWAKRAVRLNPKETGYRYLQALLYQSLGMYPEAMEQLELVVRMARSEALRAEAQKALEALEDSFLPLIEDLLRSDWSFRVECLRDVRSALRSRGFRLSESRAEGVRFLAEEISKEPPSGSRMSHA